MNGYLDYLKLVLLAIVLLVVAALLFSIRQSLPTIAAYSFITCAIIGALVCGFIAWYKVKMALLNVKQKSLEVREKEQLLLDQETTRQLAIGQFALNSHLARTRIFPNEKGHLPTLVSDDMVTLPGHLDVLMLPQYRQPALLAQNATATQREEEEQEPQPIRYEDIKHLIPRGQACMGVDPETHQVETCDFAALMTMWICGGSSTGKSNTVSLKINEAIENGQDIRLIVIDPHMQKADSLYNKIKCYEQRFLFRVASTADEINNVLLWFKGEFERRLGTGNENQNDILLIVDEVSRVVKMSEDIAKLVKEIAEVCGTESRGFGMFGWFISQRAAGLAWLRNVVITVISHKVIMMSERKLAANENATIARSMDSWPRGRVVVYGAEFEPRVLQMPLFSRPRVVESSLEEMEDLQPNTKRSVFVESAQTPLQSWEEEDDLEASERPFFAHSARENDEDGKVLVFQKNAPNRLVDASVLQSENGLKTAKEYRFTENEITEFIAAYRVAGNIEKVLASMKKGSGYKKHARELIQAYNLRQA